MNVWRDATGKDLSVLWPAARSAHVFVHREQMEAFSREAPWRLRMASDGSAMILKRWRGHCDALAIKIAWGMAPSIPGVVNEARRLAREHGFSEVISPLLSANALAAYMNAGMDASRRLVAYQSVPREVEAKVAGAGAGAHIRVATDADREALLRIDGRCFDDFWRYGPPEFDDVFAWERIVVAEDDTGMVGYAASTVAGSSCTLSRLAVDPSARRRGYASALIAHVASHARDAGALGLSLCTQAENEASQSLYSRSGFHEVSEVYTIASVDA